MSKTRSETDSLGAIEVPAEALYGAQTMRAVGNFPISGLKAYPFLIRALAMVKLAAAETNRELGLISKEQGDAIAAAAREVLDGRHYEHFVVDVFQAGAGVSLHMNANEVLANRANQILRAELGSYAKVHPNDHVNYGQSTNDVFPTAMRVSALLALEELYPVLSGLAGDLAAKGEEFADVMKAGRTHLKDATPVTLGQEFAAYAAAVLEAEAAIRRGSVSLRALGLGGTAMPLIWGHTGTNAPPSRKCSIRTSAKPAASDGGSGVTVEAAAVERESPRAAQQPLQARASAPDDPTCSMNTKRPPAAGCGALPRAQPPGRRPCTARVCR